MWTMDSGGNVSVQAHQLYHCAALVGEDDNGRGYVYVRTDLPYGKSLYLPHNFAVNWTYIG